LRLEGSGG